MTGPICSGKSTLLHAILRENYILEDGKMLIDPQTRISVVKQEPFLLSDSIERNITFGKGYNGERFDEVSKAACLD